MLDIVIFLLLGVVAGALAIFVDRVFNFTFDKWTWIYLVEFLISSAVLIILIIIFNIKIMIITV